MSRFLGVIFFKQKTASEMRFSHWSSDVCSSDLLIASLARHLDSGALDELTITTNGSQLARHASELARLGIRRINVSIDTLDPDKFAKITRWGRLAQVLEGVAAAKDAGKIGRAHV